MDILGKLLGPARVKIIKFFLLNKNKNFENQDIAKRSRVNSKIVNQELKLLFLVKFIKKNNSGYFFNSSFKYASEFEELFINSDTINKDIIQSYFKNIGRIKLLVISGIFIKDKNSRVDLLIVGDGLKRSKIEDRIKKLEAEVGIELVYAIFETKEFIYRLKMYDKLVRDILDFPHEILLQNKELSTHLLKKV